MPDDVAISVVIVHYKVQTFLQQTLRSLQEARDFDKCEVIVVDNASRDNSRAVIECEFPHVTWIALKNNIGFGKACNVGARSASGRYLLFLNPDTLLSQNTLRVSLDFLEHNPKAGIMGPKTMNPDGSLQVSCRRSFPTPAISFYRMFGLSSLFPKSKRFGMYNLTWLDSDKAAPIDAVSGSFMFMRKKLFDAVGGFDERFFMYGEDLDLCAKVKQAGYQVWYHPATQIIHFKGKSSEQRSIRSRGSFYQAMILFSRKYQHTYGTFFPSWLIYIGIVLQATVNIGLYLARSMTAAFIDVIVINASLFCGLMFRFSLAGRDSPYTFESWRDVMIMHLLMTICFIGVPAYRGVYSKERYSPGNTFFSGAIATVLFMASVYFVKAIYYSRVGFAIASVTTTFLLVGWRQTLPSLISRLKRTIYSTGNVMIVGDGPATSKLIANLEADRTASINGILWPHFENVPGEFDGYPVVGTLDTIAEILDRERVDLLLIATAAPWYSYIIEALASRNIRNVTIQWVPNEVLGKDEKQLPRVIPLHDFSV
ncbi:MAG: glycosyltransferase [Chitinivibrionales bacterium]|nr:glycosyltransferase [Chitinivibrionales bacterium]